MHALVCGYVIYIEIISKINFISSFSLHVMSSGFNATE